MAASRIRLRRVSGVTAGARVLGGTRDRIASGRFDRHSTIRSTELAATVEREPAGYRRIKIKIKPGVGTGRAGRQTIPSAST